MKVSGADRRVDGEAANKRAERLVYGYSEDPGVEDGLVTLCGGKGAGLMRMRHLSLPVPEGFVITTEACAAYLGSGELPGGLMAQVMDHLERLEEATGRGFGDPENPLLVSVRSGAPVSMPGMMDTVLDLGLNDDTVHGLAKSTKDERFAQDSHRRFIQAFGEIVLKAPRYLFEDAIEEIKVGHRRPRAGTPPRPVSGAFGDNAGTRARRSPDRRRGRPQHIRRYVAPEVAPRAHRARPGLALDGWSGIDRRSHLPAYGRLSAPSPDERRVRGIQGRSSAVIGDMSHEEQVDVDFSRARQGAFFRRMRAPLRRDPGSCRLSCFDR